MTAAQRPTELERNGDELRWSVPCPACVARVTADAFEVLVECASCGAEVAVDLGRLLTYGTA